LSNLQKETDNLIAKAQKEPLAPGPNAGGPPALKGMFTVFRANAPQLYVDVDRMQAAKLNVDIQEIFTTLQVYLGSLYVNDFNRFGRTWQVVVQAEDRFRNKVEDVKRLKVRNAMSGMVPLGTVASVSEINGPLVVTRYNMYPAAAINGATAAGVSSGDSIKVMERVAERELPKGMAYEWTEITYIQLLSGNTALILFGLAVVFVFLVLAAQYESWSLPLAVILVVPMCILGAITGVWVTNSDINIFTQVGFVVLVGLASKNAILIVEFAKHKRESGLPRDEATIQACRLRLRPILMTSFAFILGALPLLVATGAGAEMRRTLGTAVFSGMLGVTFFGIFLTPVFFYVIDRLGAAHLFGLSRLRRSAVAAWVALAASCQWHRLADGLRRLRSAPGRLRRTVQPRPAQPTRQEVPEEAATATCIEDPDTVITLNGNGKADSEGLSRPSHAEPVRHK
jgi:multidrug efflux pump